MENQQPISRDNAIELLSKFGYVQVFKASTVLTVMVTGTGLRNMPTVADMLGIVTDFAKGTYTIIEVLVNDDTFFLAVLKAK